MSELVELGSEVRRLRKKLGWFQKDLAQRVGKSVQMISDIERGRTAPSTELTRALDGVLEANGVLIRLLREAKVPSRTPGERLRGEAHLFYPAVLTGHIIPEQIGISNYRASATTDPIHDHEMVVFPNSVGVLHERHPIEFTQLSDLAVWRNQQIRRHENAVAGALKQVGKSDLGIVSDTYCLVTIILNELPWSSEELNSRAVQILAVPSILLGGNDDVDYDRENALLRSEGHIGDLVSFGTHADHIAWASWAGAVIYTHQDRFAEMSQVLIDLELLVQSLWVYGNFVQNGGSPTHPTYGREFLRAMRRSIFAAKGTEHTTARLMREAILATSRLDEVLRNAIDCLD